MKGSAQDTQVDEIANAFKRIEKALEKEMKESIEGFPTRKEIQTEILNICKLFSDNSNIRKLLSVTTVRQDLIDKFFNAIEIPIGLKEGPPVKLTTDATSTQ